MNRKEAVEIIKNSNIYGARMNGKNLIIEAINELVKDITLADLLDKELQQATKVEKKLKAYHVKDEYSYKELMKELEEQGYEWHYNKNPSDCDYWSILKEKTVIYCNKSKYLSYSRLDYYTEYETDNFNLIEYHKEEPKFYARMKGWELYWVPEHTYWNYDPKDKELTLGGNDTSFVRDKMTKSEWNELGINDSNADFEEVAE